MSKPDRRSSIYWELLLHSGPCCQTHSLPDVVSSTGEFSAYSNGPLGTGIVFFTAILWPLRFSFSRHSARWRCDAPSFGVMEWRCNTLWVVQYRLSTGDHDTSTGVVESACAARVKKVVRIAGGDPKRAVLAFYSSAVSVQHGSKSRGRRNARRCNCHNGLQPGS